MLKSVFGKSPKIGRDCFIAENAAVTGDVSMGDGCSVWYGASIRGDMEPIVLGDRVNVQDCVVLHTTRGLGALRIGNDVTLGHNATVHGAIVEDGVLIGMGATVLDGAVVAAGAIVAAGALVLGNTKIGEREIWGGVPAKFLKKVSDEMYQRMNLQGAREYVALAAEYRKTEG